MPRVGGAGVNYTVVAIADGIRLEVSMEDQASSVYRTVAPTAGQGSDRSSQDVSLSITSTAHATEHRVTCRLEDASRLVSTVVGRLVDGGLGVIIA